MAMVNAILARKGLFVATTPPTATVLEAARQMNSLRIGSLVVTDDDAVIGIVSERDILTRIVAAARDPATTTVGEIMTSPVACCRRDTSLEECRRVMTTRRIRRLPVVEEDRLIGIITIGDLVAQEAHDQRRTIADLHYSVEFLHGYLYGAHP